jgi:hypothetical protein
MGSEVFCHWKVNYFIIPASGKRLPTPASFTMLQPFAWLWASPWTVVGLIAGVVGLATGGRMQRRCGVIEFSGGAVSWLLARLPYRPAAMTLGHVVLGQCPAMLDHCRTHELVHVRQYERWGPLFIPAYLASSAIIWLRGGDPYRDNPFEREAYAVAP